MRPGVIVQLAATSAVASWLVAAAADYAGGRVFEPRAAVLLRAVLVSVVLVTTTWAVLRRHLLGTARGRLRASAGVGLLAGYAVLPTAWRGTAYASELVAHAGTPTLGLDLAAWLLVGGATAWVVTRSAVPGQAPTYTPARH